MNQKSTSTPSRKGTTKNFFNKPAKKKEDMTFEEYEKFLTKLNSKHDMKDHNLEVVSNLSRFIKRNK